MSEKTEGGNRPTHHAYFVKKDGQNKSRWLELGPVWMHEDGKGFEVFLDTLPVGGFNGRITVRANEPKHLREIHTKETHHEQGHYG